MPLPKLRSPFSRPASLGFGVALFILIANTPGTEPSIHFIKRLGTNQVIIHFYTDPNRSYSVQYLNTLSCHTNSMKCNTSGVPMTNWLTLTNFPTLPVSFDYIARDTTTNRSRFYRLLVTP
jgi:hypothetical protein